MSQQYFSALNYSLGNEDTSLEYLLCRELRPRKIVSVAGSGGRALPLLSFGAESLTALDLSFQQLYLTRLRTETYRQLSYPQFLLFWGYPPEGAKSNKEARKQLFDKLTLDQELRDYFQQYFDKIEWQSLLYEGKWEKTFATLSRLMKFIMGERGDEILKFDSLERQRKFYQQSFSHWRWSLVLFLLGNKTVFNALLYKGSFIKKNVPETHYQYYRQAFENLFTRQLAGESFFLQLCFYGELRDLRSVPVEAQEEVFHQIKASLQQKAQVQTVEQDIISYLANESGVDFVSLSDVPSYFGGDLEKNFLQMISPGLNSGAIVVVRSYLRIPQVDTQGYTEVTANFQKIIEREKVQMYRIQLFQKN